MKRTPLIFVGGAAALGTVALAATLAVVGFIDDLPLPVQGTGTLKGAVQLAQSHAVMPRDNDAMSLPKTVQDRSALVIYSPNAADGALRSLKLTAQVGTQVLGTLEMAPPPKFPKSDQHNVSDTQVEYATKAWSVNLPWHWVKPGLTLQIASDTGLQQTVSNIEIGAPSELVLQHIRVGMLTRPPGATLLETNPALAAVDYFQKIPVSRLLVSQYLPVQFNRVTLPDGTVYTKASPSAADVHSGDMREHIGKALVSVGINLANYGIHSSPGSSQNQPGYYAQVVVHHQKGNYTSGVVSHGLSGGNGMATLWDTTGNEFSHELGHNFGLGHYPNGFAGSVHSRQSGWGYDAYRHRMIGNLEWGHSEAREFFGQPVGRFASRPYGFDAMAGGGPMGTVSRYTQHTGFAANWIQKALSSYGVVDLSSSTGWRKWDEPSKTMAVLHDANRRKPTAVVRDGVLTLVGYYDPQGTLPSTIYPGLWGTYGMTYASEQVAPTSNACRVVVQGAPGSSPWVAALAASRLNSAEMNKFHINVPLSMNPSSATVECARSGSWTRLASATLQKPAQFKPVLTEVGRAEGYAAMAQENAGLKNLVGAANLPLSSLNELRSNLQHHRGPILAWRANDVNAEGGRVYEYANPYNGDTEFFVLKRSGPYGYFPTNKTSNHSWKFLGTASEVVNPQPNPLTLRQQAQPTADAAVLSYYKASSLAPWSGSGRGTVGAVYVYDNPYTQQREYFQLKTSNYGYFPINQQSNRHWDYLGNARGIEQILRTRDEAILDAAVLQWWGKDQLFSWGEGGTSGQPGWLYKGVATTSC
ncbi:M66 family metalloprotease [Ideonella paludis]|uniref:M66 family metalloprotease n=1 Tax=Ideonella paludis TaxID=1233411 RepID=UPI003638D4D9